MTYLVEVTNPYAPDDRDEERFECLTVEELAARLEDQLGWKRLYCEINAEFLAEGTSDRFRYEDPETGRTVTAVRVGEMVGGRL